MRFSIVTLSFNQRPYLQQALESVLRQGYPDLEYIVVDPGSTDGSRELIRSYGNRIAHAIFEKDSGAAEGLNKGFGMATGQIFGFLNADDILLPQALQQVASFFRTHAECDLAMGNGYLVDGEGNRLRHVKARGFTVWRYFYGGAHWLQQSTFFRRGLFLRSPRFNPGNHTCWDGELFVHMKLHGARVAYMDTDLANFRIHPTSNTGSGANRRQYREDCRRVFGEIQGRDWQAADELFRWFYRGEGLWRRLRDRFDGDHRETRS